MSQYQIEYRHNGVPSVFELFLFVNPLGKNCYTCQHEVLKLIDLVTSNIDLHILPFHNQRLVEDYMQQLGIKKQTCRREITSFNRYTGHLSHIKQPVCKGND